MLALKASLIRGLGVKYFPFIVKNTEDTHPIISAFSGECLVQDS